MKPLFTALAVCTCTWLVAQQFSAGPVLGVNYSRIQVDEHFAIQSEEYAFQYKSPGIGPSVGAYGKVTFGTMYLQGQIRFSQERSMMTMSNLASTQLQTYTTTRIQFPLLLGYRLNDLHLFAGPMVNRLLDASLVPSNEDRFALYQDGTNKTTFGYQFGLGFQVKKAIFGLQYLGTFANQGLSVTYHGIPLSLRQHQQAMLFSFSYQMFSNRKMKNDEKELIVPEEITVSEE